MSTPIDTPSSASKPSQPSKPKKPKKPKKAKKPKKPTEAKKPIPNDRIAAFFATYPGFHHDPSNGIWAEFHRMCDQFYWDRDDNETKEARRLFRRAMVHQFNSIYGTDTNDIAAWQELCRMVHIDPVPTDLTICRQRVKQVHVNLVDLVDNPRMGKPVHVFPNLESLQSYTIRTKNFFPKKEAYAGGVLRFLLREITGVHVRRRPKKRATEAGKTPKLEEPKRDGE